MRGEVYELPQLKDTSGREQRGPRYAVAVQADDLEALSTWLICPTSASAPGRPWRPEVVVKGVLTRVLVEQMRAVDPSRLGRRIGFLAFAEMIEVDRALKLVLGLR